MKKIKALIEQFANIDLIELQHHKDTGIEPDKTILYCDNWPEGEILEMAAHGEFKTFLNKNPRNFEAELLTALKIQSNPHKFLRNPMPALFQETPNVLFLPFYRKEDKHSLVSILDPFMAQTNSRIVQEHGRIIFEELFMNAVFDAPAEAKKLGYSSKKKQCEFTFAYDQDKMVISCFDPYGSLIPQKMVTRMRDIHNHGTKDIINLGQRKGGAGIGCSLLYQYSSTIVIVVEPAVGTRVTCSIPVKISQKNFYTLGKNLQIFNLTPSGGHHDK
jgi:hypothetical protein